MKKFVLIGMVFAACAASVCAFEINGYVLDAENAGVPGIVVGLNALDSAVASRFVQTDKTGRFVFEEVAAGNWRVLAGHGYLPQDVKVDADSQEKMTVRFHPYVGEKHRLSVRMSPGMADAFQMQLFPTDNVALREYNALALPDPGNENVYVFTNLVAGDYFLRVRFEDANSPLIPIAIGESEKQFKVEQPDTALKGYTLEIWQDGNSKNAGVVAPPQKAKRK